MPDDAEPSTDRRLRPGSVTVAEVDDPGPPQRRRVWPPERVLVATLLRREGREPVHAVAARPAEAGRHARHQRAPIVDAASFLQAGVPARLRASHVAALGTAALAVTITGIVTGGEAGSQARSIDGDRHIDRFAGAIVAATTSGTTDELGSAVAYRPGGGAEWLPDGGGARSRGVDEIVRQWRDFSRSTPPPDARAPTAPSADGERADPPPPPPAAEERPANPAPANPTPARPAPAGPPPAETPAETSRTRSAQPDRSDAARPEQARSDTAPPEQARSDAAPPEHAQPGGPHGTPPGAPHNTPPGSPGGRP